MGQTSIEWTDRSLNPIRARLRDAEHAGLAKGGYASGIGHYCEKISPGCAFCYSSGSQPRFGMPEFPGVGKGEPKVELFFDESRLREVLRRKVPTKWFWNDMTDLFGRWVPDEWIDKCFAVMALTPHHTHQILTKRPERAAEYLTGDRLNKLAKAAVEMNVDAALWMGTFRGVDPPAWPLTGVWIGTSVENQKAADERIPHLLNCPAVVRFLSVEPLLGLVDLSQWLPKKGWYLARCDTCGHIASSESFDEDRGHDDSSVICPKCQSDHVSESRGGISWAIVGGESGRGGRRCNVQWIRSILDQCRAAGVACFIKQLGARPIDNDKALGGITDSKGGDWSERPEDLRVREFPTIAATTTEAR